MVVIHGQAAFATKPPLHWKWITAHEIGHQYWGEYMMSGDVSNRYTNSWLMIGLGICADRAYIKYRNLGDQKHDSFYERYLEGVKKRFDTTADASVLLLKRQRFDRNNVLIHGKGYTILSALSSVVGKETFKNIYLTCIEKFKEKRLSYRDFWKISEEVYGENLGWFFNQWVRSSDYLCYRVKSVESRREGKTHITKVLIKRASDSISMPIQVKAIFLDGSEQFRITNRLLDLNVLRFESKVKVKEIILDPENRLAMLSEPLSILPEELPQKVQTLKWKGESERALELYVLAKRDRVDSQRIWFKLGSTIFAGGHFETAFDCFRQSVKLNPNKETLFVSYIWMGNIMDAQGKRSQAIKYYKKSLKYDPGWANRHDQFGIESSKKWAEERIESPYDWKQIIKK